MTFRHYIFTATAMCLSLGTATRADIIHGENVILDSSAVVGNSADRMCIGDDCVDGETFSGNHVKLRLKDQSVSLQLDDIDGSSWELIANPNSTIDTFHIREIDGSTMFTIEGGAPTNSFYVADDGYIGLGTSLPQQELHLTGIGTMGMLLERTGSGAGKWKLGVSNVGMFVQDSVSQQVPFRINTAAPTDALIVQSDGDVGFGTGIPASAMHVLRTDNTAALLIEETGAGTLGQMTLRNNGTTFLSLEDTSITAGDFSGRIWNFQNNNGTFRITTAPGGAEMLMTAQGDMTISGELTTAGSCSVGCDRVFDASYMLPSIADHNAAMWENGYLPNVGPTLENAPFNVSDKMGRMLNELEHAHIFIGQQQGQIEAQDDRLATQDDQIAAQDDRIAALEAKLEALLSE